MDDDSLHSLLSKGRLSGAQRDRILERVLDEHAPVRKTPRWVIAAAVALPAAALVALAVGLRSPSETDPQPGWLVPKGDQAGAHLEARCPERAPGQCKPGDRLLFSVDGVSKQAFFAAYAECGSRERIWYFPASDGFFPTVRPSQGHTLVDRAARIGAEHGTGPCKVRLYLLEKRTDRATLLAGKARVLASAVVSLEVVP